MKNSLDKQSKISTILLNFKTIITVYILLVIKPKIFQMGSWDIDNRPRFNIDLYISSISSFLFKMYSLCCTLGVRLTILYSVFRLSWAVTIIVS